MLKLEKVGKVWYVIGTRRGVRVRRSTKCEGWDDALEQMQEFNESLVKDGVLPTGRAILFTDLVSIYKGGKEKARREVSRKQDSLISKVVELFGHIGVREFKLMTPMDVLDEGLWDRSEGTKKKYMGMVTAIWNYSAKRGFVKPIVFEKGYRDGRVDEFIDEPLRDRLLIDMKRFDGRASAVMEFLFLTGVRYSEMRRISMDDVREKGVMVYNFKGVNGRRAERIVPLNERAREIINSGCLKGLPEDTSWLRGKLQDACRRMGEDCWRVHDARHSFASVLVGKGTELVVIRDLLGHSSVTTTERYAKVSRVGLEQAINAL
jgi:integrase